jgi:adenylate kinase
MPKGVEQRLILIGPPGSGKGTQAKLLSERLHLAHIATGDILNEARRQKTPLGKIADVYMTSGQLVPDDLVNELVADCFRQENRPERFILDGYPRTVAQAASFDQVLRQQFLNLTAVVVLQVDDEEIVRRILNRRVCSRCNRPYHLISNPPKVPGVCDDDHGKLIQRPDDREEVVRKRLQVYHENTEGLIPHYQRQGLIREVRGVGDIEQIYANILQVLK